MTKHTHHFSLISRSLSTHGVRLHVLIQMLIRFQLGAIHRLGLLIYMNRWTKDVLGGEHVEGRWAGFCQAQLLWADRILWRQDIGLPRDRHEWDLVRLPTIPDDVSELPLCLRVIHLKNADGMRPIVFVGPIRLIEMPE